MIRKIMKLTLISLISMLNIIVIAIQIGITSMNFRWSPRYDAETVIGMWQLALTPMTWVILILLLCMNFIIKEMNINGKIILGSIVTYAISISLCNLLTLISAMIIYAVLIISILANTIRVFSKVVKENHHTT